MSTATAAPPSEIARIYVGNLVPAITNASLTRLLSRFGEASHLERSSRGSFAHVSLRSNGDEGHHAVDRCISSLNRTSWCGTTLRVEKTTDHFMVRLRREWAESAAQTNEPKVEALEAEDVVFAHAGKGKHTKFSFPDIEQQTDIEDLLCGDSQGIDPDTISKAHDENETMTAQVHVATELNQGPAPSSKRLDATVQLFGLALSEEQVHRDRTGSREKRSGGSAAPIPAKRARIKTMELEHVKAVERDPTLISLHSEKEGALSVLESMFPGLGDGSSDSTEKRDAVIVSCRRLGLYRKLVLQQRSQSGGRAAEKNKIADVSVAARVPPGTQAPANRRGGQECRRAGLYRKLANIDSI